MKVQKKRHFCWRDKNHAHRFHVFYSVEIMELYYRTVWFTHLGENFVKITCFTKEVTKYKLKRCFDEIFFSVSKFFCFRHCVFVFDSFWFSKNDFQLCLLRLHLKCATERNSAQQHATKSKYMKPKIKLRKTNLNTILNILNSQLYQNAS